MRKIFETSSFARQQWLEGAVLALRAEFEKLGHTVPTATRISVGWPRGACGGNGSTTIGQCWYAHASTDGHNEIFISPSLRDGARILDVIAHELVHAIAGATAGHGKAFKQIAVKIGLTGKMTATVAGPAFSAIATKVLARIGQYPGGAIATSAIKKQTTRLVKCECSTCGYVVRTTRKWIEDVGAPHCPVDGEMEAA